VSLALFHRPAPDTNTPAPNASHPAAVPQPEPEGEKSARVDPPVKDQSVPRTESPAREENEPLATANHDSGLRIDVLEVRPDDEGLLTIRWRYRNPTARSIELIAATLPIVAASSPPNTAAKFWASVSYVAGKPVDGELSAERVIKEGKSDLFAKDLGRAAIEVRPGQSFEVWAKFRPPPRSEKTITLYLMGTPPLRNIPIQGPSG
jgi:hypothetical protein